MPGFHGPGTSDPPARSSDFVMHRIIPIPRATAWTCKLRRNSLSWPRSCDAFATRAYVQMIQNVPISQFGAAAHTERPWRGIQEPMISQLIGRTRTGQAPAAAAAVPDGALDPVLSSLARLAANACASPLASIAIFGCGEAWCTAASELPPAAAPRINVFAYDTVRAVEVFEMPDTTQAIGSLAVRSYAGCALRTAGGDTLGTLAVYGTSARFLSQEQRTSLLLLAQQAVARAEVTARLTELSLLSDARPAPPPHPDGVSAEALLESAPVAIYHTDAAGNMTYSNPEYRRIFGLEPGHSPDAWAKRVHPGDREHMERAWADFCRRPRPIQFDYRTQSDDNAVRHYSERVVAADGVPGWVGTITDFTDLVAARDHVRKAETLFSNTFDQAPIGIIHADRRGRLLRSNQSFW